VIPGTLKFHFLAVVICFTPQFFQAGIFEVTSVTKK